MYISEVQNRIASIYPNSDIGVDYMYSYLNRQSAYISISIDENEKPERIKKYFIKSISWLVAIFNKINRDIVESVLRKYPEMCPYCLSDRCVCHKVDHIIEISAAKKITEVKDKFNFYILNKINEYDLNSMSIMLNNIYSHNEVLWFRSGNSYHFKRVFQEMGELHEAISRYIFDRDSVSRITDELSDVFAWISSAWRIMFPNSNLDEDILIYYDRGCPACKNPVCACDVREDRIDRVISRRRIDEAINYLYDMKNMADIDPSVHSMVDSFMESLISLRDNNVEYVKDEISKEARRFYNILDSVIDKGGRYASSALRLKELIDLFF